MVKVLAAELSDQSRLARGKRYWADNSVIDIVIGHGSVTAEVQGARPEPYVVTLETTPGRGVPAKRAIRAHCTCPDGIGSETLACKHVVAALFALADEVSIEPALLDRWRRSDIATADAAQPVETGVSESRHDPESAAEPRLEHVARSSPRFEPSVDDISIMLAAPNGAGPPSLPTPTRLDHGNIRDRLLAEALGDALRHLSQRA